MAVKKQLVVTYSSVAPITLGAQKYLAYSYTIGTKNVRDRATKKLETGSVHHINLFDRSGSMYREIDDVIDQAQILFSQIRPQDFWSVIWFSGEGDYATLLKGAQYNDKLSKVLDSLRSIRGTTCFSESIVESGRIIDELSTIADKVVITLFTDGCPVVANPVREMNLCRDLVDGMRKKIVAFNCIGFGNYYNREFMQSLADQSEQGQYVHISRIQEFEPVYRATAERSRDLSQCVVSLTAPGADILYQSGEYTLLKSEELDLNQLNLDDNLITVLAPESSLGNHTLTIDENNTPSSATGEHVVLFKTTGISVRETPFDDLTFAKAKMPFTPSSEFLYGYAAALYAGKKTKQARSIVVRDLGDKTLADAMNASFTYTELGETARLLNEAIGNPGARNMGTCDASYIPDPNAICVMDVLAVLADSQSLYVPFAYRSSTEGFTPAQFSARDLLQPYKRVREKTIDSQDIFESDRDELQVRCDDLVYAEDRPNVSLRFTIPGYVTLNARATSRVGLPEEYPAKRYQVHTFIKDGNLNVNNAEFIMDMATYNYMVLQKVPMTVLSLEEGRAIIHLDKMPVINEKMMNYVTLDLTSLSAIVRKQTNNEALQKALKERIKAHKQMMGVAAELSEDFSTLSEDQVQVLLDHGIDKRSVYGGISRERVERPENADFYMVREISLYVAGISSLPSVASVVKKLDEKKKLTPREEVLATAMKTVESIQGSSSEDTLDLLESLLGSLKGQLSRTRSDMSKFKIAMVLNGDFETLGTLNFNDKGTAEFDGICLTMKRVQQFV